MNGYERITAALKGRKADTTPVMLHNFMMAAGEAGISMHTFRTSPAEITRAFQQAVDHYQYDGIVLDIDTVTLAGAVGVPIDFPDHEPARARNGLLPSLQETGNLPPPETILTSPGVNVWLEAARALAKSFRNDIFLRGNCDQSPFTLAGLIRGMEAWMTDLLDPTSERAAHALLEYCTNVTCVFLRAMADTGVHMVSNGDSAAGPDLVSPSIYRRFALPYERRVASLAHALGLPYVLHICGDTGPILSDMLTTGADGLELDYKTDPVPARNAMANCVTFIGNIDPSGVLARGNPDLITRRTRDLLAVFAGTPRFILNAGCAIPPTTPPENLHAMIAAARSCPS